MAAKNIALINAPVVFPKYPPIGLGFLQAYLLKHNINARIFDVNLSVFQDAEKTIQEEWFKGRNNTFEYSMPVYLENQTAEVLQKTIKEIKEFDCAGFTCFKSNLKTAEFLAEKLKQQNPKIRIIFGGPEILRIYKENAETIPDNVMTSADFIVIGEGEKPLLDYLNGNISKRVAVFDELPVLDVLPIPEYSGMDLQQYSRGYKIPIQFSRGCVRRCSFCTERYLIKKYRTRPAQDIVDEMKYHGKKNHPQSFVFVDSMLNADCTGFEALLDCIIAEIGAIPWEAQIGIRTDMPERIFGKLKKSGCYNLFVGLETGSDATLLRMRKGYTSGEALLFFEKLNSAGLHFGVSIITNFPGETKKDFDESLEFLIKNKGSIPGIEQINPYIPVAWEPVVSDNTRGEVKVLKMVSALKQAGYRIFPSFTGNLIER